MGVALALLLLAVGILLIILPFAMPNESDRRSNTRKTLLWLGVILLCIGLTGMVALWTGVLQDDSPHNSATPTVPVERSSS